MNPIRALSLTAVGCLSVTGSQAALIGVSTWQPDVPGTPAGFSVNDLFIDFEGQLFGQQMVVELRSGSIFQHPFGSESPPSEAFFAIVPELASDSFVTIGGPTTGTSEDILVVGGSTELGMNGPLKFDSTGVNIAWAPAPGVVITDRTGFMIARLTLSDDAEGAVFMFSNSGGVGTTVIGNFTNGSLCGICPEPTGAVLAGLALVGFAARRNG